MIRKVGELDLGGKTVFLRVDFNVPIDQGKIMEPHPNTAWPRRGIIWKPYFNDQWCWLRIASARKSGESCATRPIGLSCWKISAFTRRKRRTMLGFRKLSLPWQMSIDRFFSVERRRLFTAKRIRLSIARAL